MTTPHKHAELIKQWAKGAEIEQYDPFIATWFYIKNPSWWETVRYRIKPEQTPDIVRYQFVTDVNTRACIGPNARSIANLMLVFDGETGALKDAQVLANV